MEVKATVVDHRSGRRRHKNNKPRYYDASSVGNEETKEVVVDEVVEKKEEEEKKNSRDVSDDEEEEWTPYSLRRFQPPPPLDEEKPLNVIKRYDNNLRRFENSSRLNEFSSFKRLTDRHGDVKKIDADDIKKIVEDARRPKKEDEEEEWTQLEMCKLHVVMMSFILPFVVEYTVGIVFSLSLLWILIVDVVNFECALGYRAMKELKRLKRA